MSNKFYAGKKTLVVSALLALGLTACGNETAEDGDGGNATAEESIELNVASWATPGSISEYMGDWWYQEIEERTDGQLTFNVAAGDTLCSSAEIPECVRDGRADVGHTLTDYSAQLFPMATVASIPFLNQNGAAITNALYDLSTEHEGVAQAWDDLGLHMVAHVPPGRLLLGGNTELSSLDDLEGLRLRMSGPYAEHAVDAAGASTISLTAPETYEAMERGVADAAGFPLDGLVAYQLKDVLSEWTDPGIGNYTTIGMWINKDVYEELPDDVRDVVDEVTEEFNREQAASINADVLADICTESLETVGEIGQWEEEETEQWRDELGDSMEELWIEEAERDGLQDAEGYLEAYKEKLASYEDQVTEDPTLVCAEG